MYRYFYRCLRILLISHAGVSIIKRKRKKPPANRIYFLCLDRRNHLYESYKLFSPSIIGLLNGISPIFRKLFMRIYASLLAKVVGNLVFVVLFFLLCSFFFRFLFQGRCLFSKDFRSTLIRFGVCVCVCLCELRFAGPEPKH